VGGVQHLPQVVLVDLEHRVGRLAGLGQGRRVPGRHVGAEAVGGDVAEHADRRRGQPGRRGLAVGARDEGDLAPRGQVGQQVRIDHHPDLAPDDGAVAAPGGTGQRGSTAGQ
jgi:hypothetical protein